MPTRKIIHADNLEFLRTVDDGSVDLIYIDPPFNTGKRQERRRIKTARNEQDLSLIHISEPTRPY